MSDSGIKVEAKTGAPRTARVAKDSSGLAKFTSVQAAINYAVTQSPSAASPWTVYIYPGIYNEAITMASWVNLKGIGPKGSVVIYQSDNNIVSLADNVLVENLTVRLGNPTGLKWMFRDVSGGCKARISDVVLEVTTPGASSFNCFVCAYNDSDFTLERCTGVFIGSTGAPMVFNFTGKPFNCRLFDCDFSVTTTTTGAMIDTEREVTLYARGSRFAGTCEMFRVSGGELYFDNCALLCTGAWTTGGSNLADIRLRNCSIEGSAVGAGNVVVIRLKNCSYRAIQRTGTGNIVDESPYLSDAPWKVHKWNWMIALANMDVALRGTPVDAGSGQILLEVDTAGAADQEAVETNPEAAGSLGNKLTPAKTPRFITQIVVDNFHADADMFFGLRETLGNAIPDIAVEECAGFDWNGTNFRAISSDGLGVGVATNLTTPSVNVQHQLEVIVFGGDWQAQRVEFYVDGVLVATHTVAAGRPSAVLDWQHLLNNGAGGGAAGDIDVTVRNGGVQECPA